MNFKKLSHYLCIIYVNSLFPSLTTLLLPILSILKLSLLIFSQNSDHYLLNQQVWLIFHLFIFSVLLCSQVINMIDLLVCWFIFFWGTFDIFMIVLVIICHILYQVICWFIFFVFYFYLVMFLKVLYDVEFLGLVYGKKIWLSREFR